MYLGSFLKFAALKNASRLLFNISISFFNSVAAEPPLSNVSANFALFCCSPVSISESSGFLLYKEAFCCSKFLSLAFLRSKTILSAFFSISFENAISILALLKYNFFHKVIILVVIVVCIACVFLNLYIFNII